MERDDRYVTPCVASIGYNWRACNFLHFVTLCQHSDSLKQLDVLGAEVRKSFTTDIVTNLNSAYRMEIK